MSKLSNAECVEAGREFATKHGEEAWINLCAAWGMDATYSHRVKVTFLAGLAMGFVEALKMVRDASEESLCTDAKGMNEVV